MLPQPFFAVAFRAMSDKSRSTVTIDAAADAVFAALADVANYPTWSKAIKEASVKSSDSEGRPATVFLKIDAGVMKDRVTLDYDFSAAPGEISFTFNDADLLTDMAGKYSIKAIDADTTELSYELEVALSMPVPAMMRQKAEKATIDQALSELKAFLED